MKLKDLKSILYSQIGEIQAVIIYNYILNKDVEIGCSIEYAVANYGDCIVKRISSTLNPITALDCLVITI